MPAYVTLGSNDIAKARAFYDELMETIGWAPLFEHGSGGRVYGDGKTIFGIVGPFDGKAATAGNGTMIGFALESADAVKTFHAKLLELGGNDEGEPGPRGPDGQTFMAYGRDLDGNKICALAFLSP